MKKNIFLFLTFSTLLLNAQTDSLKAYQENWGVALNVSGLINNVGLSNFKDVNNNNSLLAKYFFKDNLALRFGTGINTVNNKFTAADSVGTILVEVDSTFKRNDVSFSVGIEKHLGNAKRLDPFIGAEFAFGFIGRSKADATTKQSDASGTSTLQRIVQQDGGSAVSLNFLAGFNYFFSDKFSLGAETALGYTYLASGGNYSVSIVDTPVSGTGNSSFNRGINKQTNSGLQVKPSAALILSFYF